MWGRIEKPFPISLLFSYVFAWMFTICTSGLFFLFLVPYNRSNGSNAVALLGLLLLINLLRVGTLHLLFRLRVKSRSRFIHFWWIFLKDILNQVTTTTAAATGRKKRAIPDPFQEWFSNLGQGGIQTLTYEVAATILPLLVMNQVLQIFIN